MFARTLRSGGVFVCTFSNRCFPTKAIRRWLTTGDLGPVAMCFELTAGFATPTMQHRNANATGDPIYVVWAGLHP